VHGIYTYSAAGRFGFAIVIAEGVWIDGCGRKKVEKAGRYKLRFLGGVKVR
jgi:hypothetical protein